MDFWQKIVRIKKSRWLRCCYDWLTQFCDPPQAMRAVRGLRWYLSDIRQYRRLPNAEPLHLIDTWPHLHDRSSDTPIDAHYFWMCGWAMRRILSMKPRSHVDVGSYNLFVNSISAALPVTFIDYRPLNVQLSGLRCLGGDILNLPLPDKSVESISCLSVAEHIGLGRYGEPLNPLGTNQACNELSRVLAPAGNLYFALPVGKPRVCFNAHRIHAPEKIIEYFENLELIEFSCVHDNGRYAECINLTECTNSNYANGMFWFRKPI